MKSRRIGNGGAIRPDLYFAGFALLIAARDVLAELVLDEDPIGLAFSVCSTIVVLSLATIAVEGRLTLLLKKLGEGRTLISCLALGLLCATVYGVTFTMIDQVGAGLFDLLDYGLAPLFTAVVGVVFLNEKAKGRHLLGAALFMVGVWLLVFHEDMSGGVWIAVAVLSPVATTLSDVLTSQLLRRKKDPLGRSELLVVRFGPAAVFLALFAELWGSGLQVSRPGVVLPISVVCGYLPLFWLCKALQTIPQGSPVLLRLAAWEILIPLAAFLGTLSSRTEHQRLLPLLGAGFIMLSLATVVRWRRALGGNGEGPLGQHHLIPQRRADSPQEHCAGDDTGRIEGHLQVGEKESK